MYIRLREIPIGKNMVDILKKNHQVIPITITDIKSEGMIIILSTVLIPGKDVLYS